MKERGMDDPHNAILYRAHRLRFFIGAAFLVPMTVGIVALGYDGIFLGDSDVRGVWFIIPVGLLYIWFDYIVLAKLVRPPVLEISTRGIRWQNDALLQWNTYYDWKDVEGPNPSAGAYGVPLLQIVVKATGRKLTLPPSHFGATYDEIAAVMSAARAGQLISPEQWRAEHPPHRFRHWVFDWLIPIAGGLVVAAVLIWLRS